MEKKSIGTQLPENTDATGNPPKKRGTFVWAGVCVLLSFWMFFLGILVGRGMAPVQFDTQSLQKELLALKNAAIEKTLRQYETDSKNADERKGVVFYDVLKRSEDGPDPQWSPRQRQQPSSPWPPAPLDPPESPAPAETAEPQATSVLSGLPGPPEEKPGAGETKPVTETKDPNAPVPLKVMSEAFKKPAALKATAMLKTHETVKLPEKIVDASPVAGSWTIQVAALKDTVEADRIVGRLKQQGYPAFRLTGEIVGKGVWHRVRIGPYQGRDEANGVVAKLSKEGLSPIAINTGGKE